jgi:hypothetical protein
MQQTLQCCRWKSHFLCWNDPRSNLASETGHSAIKHRAFPSDKSRDTSWTRAVFLVFLFFRTLTLLLLAKRPRGREIEYK